MAVRHSLNPMAKPPPWQRMRRGGGFPVPGRGPLLGGAVPLHHEDLGLYGAVDDAGELRGDPDAG